MKIVSDNLYYGLSFFKNIISSSPYVPILRNVKLSSDGTDVLHMFGKNNETGSISVPAVCSEPFEFIVPYNTLFELVSEIRKSADTIEIIINKDKTSIQVKYNKSSVSVRLEDETGFPLEVFPSGNHYNMDTSNLLKLLTLEAFATGDRYILTTVHLEHTQDVLISEATNAIIGGYRTIEMLGDNPFDIVVPANFARILTKQRIQEKSLLLHIDNNMIFVSGDGWYVGSQLHDGQYMNMLNVYKNSGKNHLKIDKNKLLEKLRILRIISTDDMIYLDINSRGITLSANSLIGEVDETIEVEELDDVVPVVIALSYKHLEKVLHSLQEDVFVLQTGTSFEPLLVGENDSLYFQIPMHHNKK